jgi:hypothetical protein
MNIQIQVIVDGDESTRRDIARIERGALSGDSLGLQLSEAKQLLMATQSAVVEAQASEHLSRFNRCPACQQPMRRKGQHTLVVRSLFGTLKLSSLRLYHCACDKEHRGSSFSPLAQQLPDRTLPERLYLESKWASLLSYGLTTRLLEDTLPLEGKIHVNSVRNHAYRAARRLENELTVDPQSHRIEAEQWPQNNIPPPKPRITVGLDGGYIRARDAPSPREGWFEAITGRSTVEAGTSKCFAFVQRIDRHAEPRMCWLFKDQGMVYHQPVTFVSDGGETVRSWPSRLHPGAEHVLDWFHITMRFTVLQQMAKSIAIPDLEARERAEEPATLLTSAKWFLWHGNVHRSLERLDE